MNAVRLMLWKVWDMVYPKLVGLRYVDKNGGNIFRVALRKYKGPKLNCSDGTEICNGDLVGELHLYNLGLLEKLKHTDNEAKWAIITLQEVRKSLLSLAAYLCNDHQGKRMKAIVARTVLHRGARQLGFDVQDIQSGLYSAIKIPYLRWIFKFCHPNGTERLKRGREKLVPKYVFVSREALIDRYAHLKPVNQPTSYERDYLDFALLLEKLTD
ncbi:MAG: hypothetical protein WD907_06500 [Bacilli bacterium]